jgi:hypothetical protein
MYLRWLTASLLITTMLGGVGLLLETHTAASPPTPPAPQQDLTQLLIPSTTPQAEPPCLPFENLLHLRGCPMVLV